MFIEFERGLSDAKRWFRKSDLSLRNFCGKNVAQAPPRPANPNTESQAASRATMREAAAAWRALPEEARAAWNAYAVRHGGAIADQLYKDLCGWDVFLPAWRNRSLLGAAPAGTPLPQAPPQAVAAVEEVWTGDPETFSFRLRHSAAPGTHMLLVRLTPPTATRARRPYARTARLIAGHTAGSLLPLPDNGGVLTFTAPPFAIARGRRFGLALRVVRTADGVHSREFFADLLRGGPEEAE